MSFHLVSGQYLSYKCMRVSTQIIHQGYSCIPKILFSTKIRPRRYQPSAYPVDKCRMLIQLAIVGLTISLWLGGIYTCILYTHASYCANDWTSILLFKTTEVTEADGIQGEMCETPGKLTISHFIWIRSSAIKYPHQKRTLPAMLEARKTPQHSRNLSWASFIANVNLMLTATILLRTHELLRLPRNSSIVGFFQPIWKNSQIRSFPQVGL